MVRTFRSRFLTGLLVLGVGAVLGSAHQLPTAAGQEFKTVTKTFTSTGAITVPARGAADPYPATIRVSGLEEGRVKDVDLKLRGFGHEFPGDLEVLLVAPGGRNAVVIGDICFTDETAVTGLTLTLDDEAADPLPPDDVLENGRYQPADYNPADSGVFPGSVPAPSGKVALSTFDGIDPNGTWRLFIVDDIDDGGGAIEGGWSLTITARVKR